MLGDLAARRELRRLMKPRSNFRVHFSRSAVAAALWAYGEDEHAEKALAMTDEDLLHVQAIASHYEDPSHPLPVDAKRITHNHVMALAEITYAEGRIRPLARRRRRPESQRPERFTPLPPDPVSGP